MNREEAIAFIESYGWNKRRPGLFRIRELLEKTGNPHKHLTFVHVAGSNGKGSACAMLSSILRFGGFRVGLFTSPYIQDFCERIQWNGEKIPGHVLGRLTEYVGAAAEGMEEKPGQFELITAIALRYFYEAGCDIVVLEVGLGGSFDATNIIPAPEAAVIMNIGLEHTEYLGERIEEIAAQKAGIIKPGCDCVSYESSPKAVAVIERICREHNVPLTLCGSNRPLFLSEDMEGQYFSWEGKRYFLPLLGGHQLKNAAVVLETVSVLRRRGWRISPEAVEKDLAGTKWPARLEILSKSPTFILDGGHNPQCADALARSLRRLLPDRKILFLLGMLQDKDYARILRAIFPLAGEFICLTPNSDRALLAEDLKRHLISRGAKAAAADDVSSGILLALEKAGEDGIIVSFGSLYLAGEVREKFVPNYKKWIRKRKIAARDALGPEERKEKSAQIGRRILESEAFRNAKTVMLYRGIRGEVNLDFLPELAPEKIYAYPLCLDKKRMLALVPAASGAWREGVFGIPEPDREEADLLPPGEIDLVICPCTSFDESCSRLGMGGGYYDRFLPECSGAEVMAAAFALQKSLWVPSEPGDVSVDMVITEDGLYFPAAEG